VTTYLSDRLNDQSITNRHGEATVECNVQVKTKHNIITDPQLPRSFRSGTDSIMKLEESRWRRAEHEMMMGDETEAKPANFVTKIKDVNVSEGQPAHFDCRVEPIGDGSMVIEWYHNDQPLCIGSRIHTISDFGFVVLDIDWTFKRDTGTYTCRATNKYGTSESTAHLTCSSKKDINIDSQLPQGMINKFDRYVCLSIWCQPSRSLHSRSLRLRSLGSGSLCLRSLWRNYAINYVLNSLFSN
jgi:titin